MQQECHRSQVLFPFEQCASSSPKINVKKSSHQTKGRLATPLSSQFSPGVNLSDDSASGKCTAVSTSLSQNSSSPPVCDPWPRNYLTGDQLGD